MTIQMHVGRGLVEGIRKEFGGSDDILQMVFVHEMESGPLDAPVFLCAGSTERHEFSGSSFATSHQTFFTRDGR